MNIEEIRMLGNACFAAFNSNPPSPTSQTWAIWAEMCDGIPVQASPYIKSKIVELDTKPSNFGKTFRQYGIEWKTTTGYRDAKIHPCPDCDPEVPGFFYAFEPGNDGHPHSFLVRCHCNQGRFFSEMIHMTKVQAESRGYVVRSENETILGASFRMTGEKNRESYQDSHFAKVARGELKKQTKEDKYREYLHKEELSYQDIPF